MTTVGIPAGYHMGKIVARRIASPSVVVLDLQVSPSLQFRSGQWVDFVVPPYEWIGGFSPASLPSELPKLCLAVKRSNHPPSQWVHSKESRVGRDVLLQVGGSCILNETTVDKQPVTFCAGGIGISPILSMYRCWVDLQLERLSNDCTISIPPSSFLYSVSREEELVFLDELVGAHDKLLHAIRGDNEDHSLILTKTQQHEPWSDKKLLTAKRATFRHGRQLNAFIDSAPSCSAFYLCGPPSMLDEGTRLLLQKSVAENDIHVERWW